MNARAGFVKTEITQSDAEVAGGKTLAEAKPKRPLRIYAVTNQKGGLGKSTTACNIVFAAIEEGLKVLVCDSDPQGSSSAFLSGDPLIDQRPIGKGFDRVFDFVDQEEVDLPVVSFHENADLLPGTEHLDAWNTDERLTSDPALVMRAGDRLRKWAEKMGYDCIVFDTPTGHGLLQVTPMLWADVIYVPLSPAPLSMRMLPALNKTLELVRGLNRKLVTKYIVNMVLKRSKTQQKNLQLIKDAYGDAIFAELNFSVSVSDSLDCGVPVWRYKGGKENRDGWRDFAYRALELDKG